MKQTFTFQIPIYAFGAGRTVGNRKTNTIRQTVFLFNFLLLILQGPASQAQCTMVCNNQVNISLGESCATLITYDMILEDPNNPLTCTPVGNDVYTVEVLSSPLGPVIPSSPYISGEYAGQTLYALVRHIPSGNFCLGSINIFDHLPPSMICPPDVTIACNANTNPGMTGEPEVEDCGEILITYSDVYTENDCVNPVAQISRTWIAIDAAGNENICTQLISIERPSSSEVAYPLNPDGIQLPALNCTNPQTDPEFTGQPTINGQAFELGDLCGLIASYEDQELFLCDGTYKILRTWTVIDWCTGESDDHVQLIKVSDTTGPSFECPFDLTVGTSGNYDCTASVTLPSLEISDDCSEIENVQISSAFGLINGNGGTLTDVPLGNHTITYTAWDDCGNSSSCQFQLTVIDDNAPSMVCKNNTLVSLNSSGIAGVFAESFDSGSNDNCCLSELEVKRMDESDEDYSSIVLFSCEDIGEPVMVELKATDCSGNANICMVQVIVEDNLPPSINCPPDITLMCTQDITDWGLTGEPETSDGCAISEVNFIDTESLNSCNTGHIERQWQAEDAQGYSVSCIQRIYLIDTATLEVTFPSDYTLNSCASVFDLVPENLPTPYDSPTYSGVSCKMIAKSWSDEVYQMAPPACFKIIRKWTVIDWCTYDPQDDEGRLEHYQFLMVFDNDPPEINCPADITMDILNSDCTATVELPFLDVIEDCTENIEIEVSGDLGNGYTFQNVDPGTYEMNYVVSDGCGNSISCDIIVTVEDAPPPSPICLNGLAGELMESGTLEIWASDFLVSVSDNCNQDNEIDIRIGRNDGTSPPPVPQTTSLVFTCDDIGTNDLYVFAGDTEGNWNYCETYILVQDNNGVCGQTIQNVTISGQIHTEDDLSLEGVEMYINSEVSAEIITGADGQYSFEPLLIGGDYSVHPQMNVQSANGVSTFDLLLLRKHILGIEALDSPYKMIAADANRSGSISTVDMIYIRKIILNIDSTFSNNTSWRFVDADYQFPIASNPFSEPFPEIININNLQFDTTFADFIAIKVGDVNGTAEVGNEHTVANRNNSDIFNLFTDDIGLKKGQRVSVPLYAGDLKSIMGFQFSLHFDPNAMDFENVKNGQLSSFSTENIGLKRIEDGLITFSWDTVNEERFTEKSVLLYLEFTSGTNGKLSNFLKIDSNPVTAEAYTADLKIVNLKLSFNAVAKLSKESWELSNYPNPFREITSLHFYLPEDMNVSVSIYDVNGIQRKQWQEEHIAGWHEYELFKYELGAAGIYYCIIETKNQRLLRKILCLD